MRTSAPGNRYTRPLVPTTIALIGIIAMVYVGNFIATARGAAPITGIGWLPFVVVGTAIMYAVYIGFADRPIWHVGTREVVVMVLGAALYGVLGWATSSLRLTPTSQVALRPGVAVLALVAVLYGPVVGFVTGFVGNILGDALTGRGVFPVWDIGNGLMGMVAGLAIAFPGSRRSFAGIAALIGGLGAIFTAWLLLRPVAQLDPRLPVPSQMWWLPLVGTLLILGLRAALRERGPLPIGLLWSGLGVHIGVGFAALADVWLSRRSFAVALQSEFAPAAFANLIVIGLGLPLGFAVLRRARGG